MSYANAPISPQQTRSDRPRAVSSMSHASTHSHKTSKSREEKKLELTESSKDKRRLEGFSDPTKALKAAEPSAVALEESSIENIRGQQYKDRDGNVILDPDRSNPTRPRLERPLDTIRSFNAAADGTASRRSSYQRPQSQYGSGYDGAQSRPSSYYGPQAGRPGPRPGPGPSNSGYYNYNRAPNMYRGDSFPEEGEPMPRQQYGRAPVAPYVEQYEPQPGGPMRRQQYSYDTMTSGSDEMSKSTNPSSQNSSFDQLHQTSHRKPEGEMHTNPYRQQGYARNGYPPSAFQNSYSQRPSGPTDDYGMDFDANNPPVPPKHREQIMDPRMNGAGGRLQKTTSNTRPEQPAKRQSWIKRTFSKRG